MANSKTNQQPTAAELEILGILWERGPSSVRTVHDILSESKEVVYTTTLKTMQVMMDRGFLTRQENGRKHIYAPAQAQEETQSDLLDNFLQKAFGGSAMKLVMKTLGNYYKTNDGELDKLKQMIEHIEQKKDNQTPGA